MSGLLNDLLVLIQDSFGLGEPPARGHLVKFDGFDELDKTHAIEVFLGKTAQDVSRALSEDRLGTQSDIEDLLVMEPAGYRYYLAPYLIRIIQNEGEEAGNLEFAGFVMFSVREIVRLRGVEAFTATQRAALSALSSHLVERCRERTEQDTWAEPLLEDLEFVRATLRA